MSNPDPAAHQTTKPKPKPKPSKPAKKTSSNKSQDNKNHDSVVATIIRVAKKYNIPPEVALALAKYESGINPMQTGDGGHSVGLYQLYDHGLGAGMSVAERQDAERNAEIALSHLATVRKQHPNLTWGQVAAISQNPADHNAEASAVDGFVQAYSTSGQSLHTYFKSNSGGAGGGPSAPGGAAGNGELSSGDIASALDSLGFPKALIESNPSLHHAFNQILQQQLDLGTTEGQNRAMQLLKATPWWQKRTDSQRKFDAAMADPAEQKTLLQQIKQKKADLKVAAAQIGVALDGDKLEHLATLALRNGLSGTELNNALVGHFNYKPGQSYTGVIGTDINSLQQMAGQYYIKMGPDRLQHLLHLMLTDQLKPEDLTDLLKQMAISKFPALEKQLNKGLTVADIASPYLQSFGDILGINPATVRANDPLLMQALGQPDGNGGFQLMPIWQFEQQLRKDPRWANSPEAHNTLVPAAIGVLKDWGLA